MAEPMLSNKLLTWVKAIFTASVLIVVVIIIVTMWWSTDHLNIDSICNNTLTYAKNVNACNNYFHSDNIFNEVTTPPEIIAFIGFFVGAIGLMVEAADRLIND